MIDLHTHSTFSDGSFTPEQLVQEAVHVGLSAVALTDHDCIAGLERFLAACKTYSVRGVPGVEISMDYPGGSMHLLGYFLNHHDEALGRHIARLTSGRVARNDEILKKMNNLGLTLTLREVGSYAGENNIGRLHFAQALVARGYVQNREEAFAKYLGKGKAAYSERPHMMPAEGVAMIRNAGGVAVLAHPFTLNLGKQALIKMVDELVQAGLHGIEVYYPQQMGKQFKLFKSIAEQFNLVASGGSDFHGAPMPDIKLGRGFGELNVPDSVLAELEARRP